MYPAPDLNQSDYKNHENCETLEENFNAQSNDIINMKFSGIKIYKPSAMINIVNKVFYYLFTYIFIIFFYVDNPFPENDLNLLHLSF